MSIFWILADLIRSQNLKLQKIGLSGPPRCNWRLSSLQHLGSSVRLSNILFRFCSCSILVFFLQFCTKCKFWKNNHAWSCSILVFSCDLLVRNVFKELIFSRDPCTTFCGHLVLKKIEKMLISGGGEAKFRGSIAPSVRERIDIAVDLTGSFRTCTSNWFVFF